MALLAFLQYRWLGQVSEGERQRLKATLEARARDFARDFDREVTRAVGAFHVPPTPDGSLDSGALAARWNDWRQGAPYPDLIREVLFLQVGARDELALQRLDREGRTFVPASWPPELEAWRGARRPGNGSSATAGVQTLWAALEDTPVILVTMPFVRVFSRSDGALPPPDALPRTSSFLLVSLDLDLIRSRILPQLVSRYFSTEDIFDYRVAVAQRGDASRLIFTSDPTPADGAQRAPSSSARQASPADAVVPLFAVRLAEFSALFVPHVEQLAAASWQQAARSGQQAARTGQKPGSGQPRDEAGSGSTRSTAQTPGGGTVAASQPPGASQRAAGQQLTTGANPLPAASRQLPADSADRLAVSVIRLRSAAGEGAIGIDRSAGRWQLRLAHRAGSVDAAVARARNRNLLVSSTVLLLLAVSFGLMVVATRRAQRLAAQQVEFVAGVTHELRTPLAVIRSAGENLADGIVESPEDVRQYGALITGEGRKLGAMVERVMDYAGMQGSSSLGPREPVDVSRLLDEVAQAMRRLPAAQGARVETEAADALPPVLADGPALARAVENLVENALKYGRADGAAAVVQVAARAEGTDSRKRVVIEVTEHGPGVEPSEREAIFEPFVRGRAAVAARVPGTGLGLSLVRRIAEAHGGRVDVRPADGEGACFAITLPAAPLH
ncbi:MAG: sensor histidine kinase [Acidobacteria bacterium]|nr:MAG: sensor histidine kinase [Acidobacteriota bacterium]